MAKIEKDETVHAGMYIFLNKGLHMSVGKAAAQAAHAAVEAYKASDKHLIEQWELGGHYAKYVLEADNAEHLSTISTYISKRGFLVIPIIDEGLTEVEPHSLTAIGIPIVNKLDAHTNATFSSFRLYKDSVRITLEIDK